MNLVMVETKFPVMSSGVETWQHGFDIAEKQQITGWFIGSGVENYDN
jgi:hypothetical protein